MTHQWHQWQYQLTNSDHFYSFSILGKEMGKWSNSTCVQVSMSRCARTTYAVMNRCDNILGWLLRTSSPPLQPPYPFHRWWCPSQCHHMTMKQQNAIYPKYSGDIIYRSISGTTIICFANIRIGIINISESDVNTILMNTYRPHSLPGYMHRASQFTNI